MEPERIKIKEELKKLGYEHFEEEIFVFCYYDAIKRQINLDWDSNFANWYIVQSMRIIENIKLFPEFFKNINSENLMEYRDVDINDKLKKYIVTTEERKFKINYEHVCGKCKNVGVYVDKVQKRSLDEGTTSYYTCSKCVFR